MKRPRFLLTASIAVFSQPQVAWCSSLPPSYENTINNNNVARDLQEWIRVRCGIAHPNDDQKNPCGAAIWAYEGALLDPMDGRVLATVEGLELVRCVGQSSSDNSDGKAAYQSSCGDLQVAPLIGHPNATFAHAATIWSRKLFCYRATKDNDNDNDIDARQTPRLLRQFRMRPNAPVRTIPTNQAVVVYDTATTFIATSTEGELIVHSEWPDGQSLWARATRQRRNSQDSSATRTIDGTISFDFTVYARQKSVKKKPTELFDLTKPTTNDTRNGKTPKSTTSPPTPPLSHPPRAKWLEFGTSSSQGKHKFGARESYSYRTTNTNPESPRRRHWPWQRQQVPQSYHHDDCTVKYSRYGEGPPFVGPGRVCSLELQGRRVDTMDQLPPLTKSLLQTRLPPQFWSSMMKEDDSSSVFRACFRNPPALLPSSDDKEDLWLPDVVRRRTKAGWQRARSATEQWWRRG